MSIVPVSITVTVTSLGEFIVSFGSPSTQISLLSIPQIVFSCYIGPEANIYFIIPPTRPLGVYTHTKFCERHYR